MTQTKAKNHVIYGVKVDEQYHYIGKMMIEVNDANSLLKSDCHAQYSMPSLRQVFVKNKNTVVEQLHVVDGKQWYGAKLSEVYSKYNANNPLKNAQWMLEGKRGYWDGKKRDYHTLKMLSESKFIKVVEYDSNGMLKKIWGSAKEIGETVFKDYKVVNGSAESRIYRILDNKLINKKFHHNSYWFRLSELSEFYGDSIPIHINLNELIGNVKIISQSKRKKVDVEKIHAHKYTVIRKNSEGVIIGDYLNSYEAAYELKIREYRVRKLCRGEIKNSHYILSYGDKKLQPLICKYPEYVALPLPKDKKPKKVKTSKKVIHKKKVKLLKKEKIDLEVVKNHKHRLQYTVIQYDANMDVIGEYENTKIAAQVLGISDSAVVKICNGKRGKSKKINLKYGEKR